MTLEQVHLFDTAEEFPLFGHLSALSGAIKVLSVQFQSHASAVAL